MTAERYVDAHELATTLGVSRTTIKRWVAAGCPSETWGMRVRRFRVSDVAAWARARQAILSGDVLSGAATPPERSRRKETSYG